MSEDKEKTWKEVRDKIVSRLEEKAEDEKVEEEELELEAVVLEDEEVEEEVEETQAMEMLPDDSETLQMVEAPVRKMGMGTPQTQVKYKLIRKEKGNKVHKYMGKTKRY